MSEYHNPVLLNESIDALVRNRDGVYADATFGGGGHSRAILAALSEKGRLFAFDRDSDALAGAPEDSRFKLIHNNFRFIHNYALLEAPAGVDGILADLGGSSHQFDTPGRGFSFRFDAPLDMRMNVQGAKTASDIVNSYTQEELERIFRIYGEVDNARKAAQLIVAARTKAPVLTTGDLGNVLAGALPSFAEHKYLAKVFQALRIEVNDELRALEKFLQGAAKSLKKGGRLVVITYHSLEDRMVKNFIRSGRTDGTEQKDIYGKSEAPLRSLLRKPVVPTEEEIETNTRARSAHLRVAEKI
ncbi:MAG: 16S rRNA (cytosine(1402)-N(4))-methyltransferase RsmH [Bacteroidales bacterium]|nr:16S rRNA (cytosine(1402)-N(4))-methyltransferase RsmH [Bacteroidales bacterium]